MIDLKKILCEMCNEREATHCVLYDHPSKAKDLCAVCYKLSAPPDELERSSQINQTIRNGNCQYCGSPAIEGATGRIPLLNQTFTIWCERCKLDLIEFFRQPENQLANINPTDAVALKELSHRLNEMRRRQEEFMKRKVKERKGKT